MCISARTFLTTAISLPRSIITATDTSHCPLARALRLESFTNSTGEATKKDKYHKASTQRMRITLSLGEFPLKWSLLDEHNVRHAQRTHCAADDISTHESQPISYRKSDTFYPASQDTQRETTSTHTLPSTQAERNHASSFSRQLPRHWSGTSAECHRRLLHLPDRPRLPSPAALPTYFLQELHHRMAHSIG
jgi:hypothetical protein